MYHYYLWCCSPGLTPASEELQKLQKEGEAPDVDGGDDSSEEFYEVVDDDDHGSGEGQQEQAGASSKDDSSDLGLDWCRTVVL